MLGLEIFCCLYIIANSVICVQGKLLLLSLPCVLFDWLERMALKLGQVIIHM